MERIKNSDLNPSASKSNDKLEILSGETPQLNKMRSSGLRTWRLSETSKPMNPVLFFTTVAFITFLIMPEGDYYCFDYSNIRSISDITNI
jgi:hypothetical protein